MNWVIEHYGRCAKCGSDSAPDILGHCPECGNTQRTGGRKRGRARVVGAVLVLASAAVVFVALWLACGG